MGAVERNQYDIDSWHSLLRQIHNEKIDLYRESVYEKLIRVFPTSGKFWKVYIEHEIRARNFERVEKLFQRCLLKVLNIELWKTYLTYVKDTKASLANYKEKMAQAYEFALNNMGMDFASSSIYNDYIMFVKNFDAAGSSYAKIKRFQQSEFIIGV